MPPKRKKTAAKDKNEAPPAKTIKGEKKIESEKAPPKSQQQGATEKKEDAPETADVVIAGASTESLENINSAAKYALAHVTVVEENKRRTENKEAVIMADKTLALINLMKTIMCKTSETGLLDLPDLLALRSNLNKRFEGWDM